MSHQARPSASQCWCRFSSQITLWSPDAGSRYGTSAQKPLGARRPDTGSRCQSIAPLACRSNRSPSYPSRSYSPLTIRSPRIRASSAAAGTGREHARAQRRRAGRDAAAIAPAAAGRARQSRGGRLRIARRRGARCMSRHRLRARAPRRATHGASRECRTFIATRSAVRCAQARVRHAASARVSRRDAIDPRPHAHGAVTGARDVTRRSSTLRYASIHSWRTAGQVHDSHRARAWAVSRVTSAGSPQQPEHPVGDGLVIIDAAPAGRARRR